MPDKTTTQAGAPAPTEITADLESSAPVKTKLDLAKEAQAEVQFEITTKRLELLQSLLDHDEIGGVDKTEESLLAIVEKYPKGISYPFLQTLFPDGALVAAREALKKDGKIEQIGKKGNVILKPVIAE